jgi:hypothetical protein
MADTRGPSNPDQEIAEFIADLRKLRGVAGQPSLRTMSRASHYSHTALANALTSGRLPTLPVTLALVRACSGDEEYWANRWAEVNSVSQGVKDGVQVPHRVTEQRTAGGGVPGPGPERTGTAPVVIPSNRTWKHAAAAGILLMLSVVGWAFAGTTMAAQSAQAHSLFLGPVDLGRYCQAAGFTGVSLDGLTAYDWHCVQPPSGRSSLSVIEACRWQYKSPTATARYAEMSDPDSWQCWDHVIVLGRVDLRAYCAARGYKSPLLEGTTADKWYCTGEDGRQVAIDPDSSCRWQYGKQVLIATESHYRQPWEHWDCWG